MELCILIPAKNEEFSLPETVKNIHDCLLERLQFNIFVINDHSEDNTIHVLKDLSHKYKYLNYLDNGYEGGVGNAIQYGLKFWKGDIVSICMADNSDSPEDILALYHKITLDNCDCAFGSRFIKGSNIQNYPKFKMLLNRIFNIAVELLTNNGFNDYTNIFKMYSRRAIQTICPLESRGFSIGLEMSLKAFSKNMKVGIIPISWKQRTSGKSKLKLIRNFSVYSGTLIKCLINAK